MHGKLLYENTDAWDIKDWPVWSKTQRIVKAFPYQGVQGLEIPSKQWVRPLVGFGWSHPLALHEELQPQAKAHFFSDKRMHFERAETQGHMSKGMLESQGGAHNKQKPALDTDHPGSPRMPALASKLSVIHSMCMKPSFLPFPQPSAWNKPQHTAEQLFGKALLQSGAWASANSHSFHSQNLDLFDAIFWHTVKYGTKLH